MFRNTLTYLAAIFGLGSPWAGVAVVGLIALRPGDLLGLGLALAGAAAACAAVGCPWSRMPAVNAALVGVAIAHLTAWTPATIALTVLGGACTAALVLTLEGSLRQFGLLVLSLPYVIAVWMANLLAFGHLSPPDPVCGLALPWAPSLGAWPHGFLSSLGALIFRYDVASGLILAGLMLAHSRILFASAALGHLTGCAVRCALGMSWERACADGNGFNATLAGILVGALLLVPGRWALGAAVAAAALAALLDRALATALVGCGLAPQTLPVILAAWLVLRLAAIGRPALLPLVAEATPEATLMHHQALAARLPDALAVDIALPVVGRWSVWQGVDGPWTHRGSLRHALDFVIRDDDGRTHEGAGTRLEDYHAWRKPVLAPLSGVVVSAVDGIPDNPIGSVDSRHNWGNHVILRDQRGIHVELSHLARGSLRVAPGQWVERGTVLGLCGNSGYSAQPHVHCQVQAGGRLGDPTIPFTCAAWRGADGFHLRDLPLADAWVEAVPADLSLARAFDLVPGEVWCFHDETADRPVRWTVERSADGGLALAGDRGRLHLGIHAGCLRLWRVEGDDPWLAVLARGLPSLPLCRLDGLTWSDVVPASWVHGPVSCALRGVAGLMSTTLGGAAVQLTAHGPTRVISRSASGDVTIDLDPGDGLIGLATPTRRLVRRPDTAPEPRHVPA